MSANGLEVFDKTIHTANIWLDEIMAELGPDRQHAWKVLSIVLRKLRDRLPVEAAAHLGAQLPLIVRGAYYDQFEPAKQPSDCGSFDAFADEVAEWLADARPTDPKDAVRCVFGLLSRHVDPGQIAKTRGILPETLRRNWEAAESRLDAAGAER